MQAFLDWITGNLTPGGRVVTALAPAVLMVGYFVVAFVAYLVRCAIKGPYRDPEIESRGDSILAAMPMRLFITWALRPTWGLVLRVGIPPMAVTTLSVLLGLAAGPALAAGRFALGGWLYIFSGVCDVIDGRLARATNRVTKAGGALDSILDRYADAAVLCGLGWYYRDSWVLLPTLLALVGSSLVPYIRARGEAAGVSVKEVGLMQRAERIIYLGVGCSLSPILEVILDPTNAKPLHRIAVVGIVLLAVATQLTALQRLIFVVSTLSGEPRRSWLRQNGRTLTANGVAATVATVADFGLVNLAVALLAFTPPSATILGCVAGGAINFTINRVWTFHSREAKLPQARRYAFVSLSSALLNAGGVAVLLLLPSVDYRVAWVLVRVAVFLAWNYPLHRDYVFANGSPQVATASSVR
jgi:phosphatidylglycerophosphate synthase/putative flippase GtrA